jgi:hypothetical protein
MDKACPGIGVGGQQFLSSRIAIKSTSPDVKSGFRLYVGMNATQPVLNRTTTACPTIIISTAGKIALH